MKYIVTHTAYEIVERRFLVEAENEDDAIDNFLDGRAAEFLGDDLCDRTESEIEVAEAEHGADGIWREKEQVDAKSESP